MEGAARVSALRLGLLQDHQEQVKEGRVAGGGRPCFTPVRWSHWGTVSTGVTYSDGCMGLKGVVIEAEGPVGICCDNSEER